jgi:polysaccharide export outer membrane protein
MMKTGYIFCLLTIAVLALPACAGNSDLKKDQMALEVKNESEARQARSAESLSRLAMQNTPAPDTDYVMGPDDLLEIQVFQAEDLHETVRVSSEGFIEMPLIGKVPAKGMTPAALEKDIAGRLQEYIKNPFVSVSIKEYRAQRISVMGAVAIPQVYVITGQKYLLDMLSTAGGLSAQAGKFCYIMRTSDGRAETIVIDLDELLDNGNLALNIPVLSGDIINVQKAGMVFIDGSVTKAGAYQLQKDTTLVKAIAMAEGLRKEASKSNIRIYRDDGKGGREVITADYDAINDGKQKDVQIVQNDIIIVPKSGLKTLFYGITDTVRGYVNFGSGGIGSP